MVGMAFQLFDKKEETSYITDAYKGIYDRCLGFHFAKPVYFFRVRDFSTPEIYPNCFVKLGFRYGKLDIDDTISRAATWNALFVDKALPEIEDSAVEKYAGTLDQYLPEGVPVDKIISHAKG